MSRKKQFSVRLRPDQERQIQHMVDDDPELDASKIIRKAIDEHLSSRVREEPTTVKKKRRSSGWKITCRQHIKSVYARG